MGILRTLIAVRLRRLRWLVVAAVLALAAGARADKTKLVVVVAKGARVTDISRADLRRCFLGERVRAGGRLLSPFNAAIGSGARAGFDRTVLGMSPDEAARFWTDRRIRGQSGAPRALPSPAYIARAVAKVPGAIGYLPADKLTAEVQAVSIDGHPYTEDEYGLLVE